MSADLFYHFTGDTLRDGRPLPAIGEWLVHDGPLVMCGSGLHASPTAFDALAYAPGALLHRVELRGVETDPDHTDKLIARERCILATIDATDVLRLFARRCALRVVHLWDCPPLVRQWLDTRNESLRPSARASARDSAWASAWASARASAWDSARASARDSAWASAWDSAWASAWDSAWDAQRQDFNALVDAAFEVKP